MCCGWKIEWMGELFFGVVFVVGDEKGVGVVGLFGFFVVFLIFVGG